MVSCKLFFSAKQQNLLCSGTKSTCSSLRSFLPCSCCRVCCSWRQWPETQCCLDLIYSGVCAYSRVAKQSLLCKDVTRLGNRRASQRCWRNWFRSIRSFSGIRTLQHVYYSTQTFVDLLQILKHFSLSVFLQVLLQILKNFPSVFSAMFIYGQITWFLLARNECAVHAFLMSRRIEHHNAKTNITM